MKSWQKPTDQQVNKALSSLSYTANQRYFFDRLENPEWLEQLDKKNFFSNPPDVIRDEKEGTILFPPWPVSIYLIKMAEIKPLDVLKIINKIPNNGNIRLYGDFIEAILKMPPEISVKLLKKVKKWLNSPYRLVSYEKLGELLINFAKGGFIEESFKLARAILKITVNKKNDKRIEDLNRPAEPSTVLEIHDYESIVKEYIPEFAKLAGIQVLLFLCNLLEEVISSSKTKKIEYEDYSYIWRPAIEAHEQNIKMGLRDILVDGIRDTTEIIIINKISPIFEVLDLLDSFKKKIFLRLKIYILFKFKEQVFKQVESILTNIEYFNDDATRHEFVLLLKSSFSLLSKEKQKFICDLIHNGPGIRFFKEIEGYQEKKLSEGERLEIEKKWKLLRYSWISKFLIGKYENEFNELTKEFGELKDSDFTSPSVSWVGPTSPKTVDELNKMSPMEVVNFLRNWKYPKGIHVPTPKGLGRSLIETIKSNPQEYSSFALKFKNLKPTYVRSLISGLTESENLDKSLDWKKVFDLCFWVENQKDETIKLKERNWDEDPGWGWTRKSIADLLSKIYEKNLLPYDYRSKSWEILRILTDDPEPSSEYEKEYGGTNMDPSTMSINTVRGKAMHAVMHYALWVRRYHEKLPDSKKYINDGFNIMPEVREVLEKHIDVAQDSSKTIRSIYGRWLPWIGLLDRKWLIEKINLIFPKKENKSVFRDVAWESYIIFCRPYNNMLPILFKEYKTAINNIDRRKELHKHYNPNKKLAEHLMVFYWRGVLDFTDYENIFCDFWNIKNLELKGSALEFIGRSLKNTKGNLPTDVIERLKKLWENRVKNTTKIEKNEFEMRAFEWWFISGKFDNDWEIKQLDLSLKLGSRINRYMDSEVVKRLMDFVKDYPVEVIECISLIAKSDEDGWTIYSWKNEARYILSEALKTKAYNEARSVINYFGSRGYIEEFRDLL